MAQTVKPKRSAHYSPPPPDTQPGEPSSKTASQGSGPGAQSAASGASKDSEQSLAHMRTMVGAMQTARKKGLGSATATDSPDGGDSDNGSQDEVADELRLRDDPDSSMVGPAGAFGLVPSPTADKQPGSSILTRPAEPSLVGPTTAAMKTIAKQKELRAVPNIPLLPSFLPASPAVAAAVEDEDPVDDEVLEVTPALMLKLIKSHFEDKIFDVAAHVYKANDIRSLHIMYQEALDAYTAAKDSREYEGWLAGSIPGDFLLLLVRYAAWGHNPEKWKAAYNTIVKTGTLPQRDLDAINARIAQIEAYKEQMAAALELDIVAINQSTEAQAALRDLRDAAALEKARVEKLHAPPEASTLAASSQPPHPPIATLEEPASDTGL
ncbi:hypothetical protein EXIGLDRAFT_784463, partial [Exidia glandulosa HHB12029]